MTKHRLGHVTRELPVTVTLMMIVGALAYTLASTPSETKIMLAVAWLVRIAALMAMVFLGLRVVSKEPRRRWVSIGAAMLALCGIGYLLMLVYQLSYYLRGDLWEASVAMATTVLDSVGVVGASLILWQTTERIPEGIEEMPCTDSVILPLGSRGAKGDEGPRGEEGDRGPRGDKGKRGDRGPRGKDKT